VQFRVGTLPLAQHLQDILSDYLQDDLGLPLDFVFDTGQETDDRVSKAQAHKIYVELGVESVDEVRSEELGLEVDNARPTPRFILSSKLGVITLASLYDTSGPIDPETAGPAEAAVSVPTAPGAPVTEVPGAPVAPPPPSSAGAVAGPTAPVVTAKSEDERVAFGRFVKSRRRSGQWRDFDFQTLPAVEAHRLNDIGRATVRKAGELTQLGAPVAKAGDDPRWDAHPVRQVESKLTEAYADPIRAAIARSTSEKALRALAAKYLDGLPRA